MSKVVSQTHYWFNQFEESIPTVTTIFKKITTFPCFLPISLQLSIAYLLIKFEFPFNLPKQHTIPFEKVNIFQLQLELFRETKPSPSHTLYALGYSNIRSFMFVCHPEPQGGVHLIQYWNLSRGILAGKCFGCLKGTLRHAGFKVHVQCWEGPKA